MKIILKTLIVTFIIVFIQGCSINYYGHTEEEWKQLSENERNNIEEEYAPIINSRTNQDHTDKINSRTESIINLGVKGLNK